MTKRKRKPTKLFKILRYFAIEIAYTLAVVLYFVLVRDNYGIGSAYDSQLFGIVILGALLIIWFIGAMLNRYFILVYGLIYILYLVTQDIYYRALKMYYRFNTALDLVSEAVGVKDSIFEFVETRDVIIVAGFIILNILFILCYFLWQRKSVKFIWRLPLKLAALLLIIPILQRHRTYLNMIDETRYQEDAWMMNKTDYYIYDKIPNTNQFVEKFGLLPFAYRDVTSFFENTVLAADEYAEIDAYLQTRPEISTNDFTGMFAGKNIFLIQAESYNRAILDEELTPTLYKMYSQGIRVQNFNTPALPGSTSDTEFMSNVSLIPNSEGHAVVYAYPDNTYPTTLAKLFSAQGYWTAAYHNNYGSYYNRDLIYPAYGYDEFYDSYKIGVADGASDSDVMNILKWMYVENEKPFLAYWITYSGHQPYTLDTFGVSAENVARIKAKYPELDDSFVSFMAKNMDLDQAMADLFTELEKVGKMDDTVFIFFGDHEVKGLDLWGDSIFYKQTGIVPEDRYRYTDLYIYNTEITEPVVYEKVGTCLDLLPTIANLWGLTYDPKTVLGRDVFDPTYGGLFFSEWEYWRTDHYQYNFLDDVFEEIHDYDENTAREEMNALAQEKEISKLILKLDYFAQK